jgi:hypothetical protein
MALRWRGFFARRVLDSHKAIRSLDLLAPTSLDLVFIKSSRVVGNEIQQAYGFVRIYAVKRATPERVNNPLHKVRVSSQKQEPKNVVGRVVNVSAHELEGESVNLSMSSSSFGGYRGRTRRVGVLGRRSRQNDKGRRLNDEMTI